MKERVPGTITKIGGVRQESVVEKGETYYHFDRLIEAYNKGVDEGEQKYVKTADALFQRNLRDASKAINILDRDFIERGLDILKAYLQIASRDKFFFLVGVSEENYLHDSFYTVYDKVYHLEKEYNNDSLQLHFAFMPVTSDFCEEIVLSDGFFELEKSE